MNRVDKYQRKLEELRELERQARRLRKRIVACKRSIASLGKHLKDEVTDSLDAGMIARARRALRELKSAKAGRRKALFKQRGAESWSTKKVERAHAVTAVEARELAARGEEGIKQVYAEARAEKAAKALATVEPMKLAHCGRCAAKGLPAVPAKPCRHIRRSA